MTHTRFALAVAALLIGGASHASVDPSNVLLSAGSSSLRDTLAVALNSLCKSAQGPIANPGMVAFEHTNGSVFTYVCPAAGTSAFAAGNVTTNGMRTITMSDASPGDSQYISLSDASFMAFASGIKEVRLNVSGSSISALKSIAGTAVGYINPALGGGLQNLTGSVGGFMDLPLNCFAGTVQTAVAVPADTIVDSAKMNQAFGVAVSSALYSAMFNKQRDPSPMGSGAPMDYPIPNSCSLGDTGKPVCVPTISKGDVASISSSNNIATIKTTGASYFGAPPGAVLRYLRRADASGTQAAVQNYFLGLPGLAQSPTAAVPEPTTDHEAGGLKDRLYNNKFRVLNVQTTSDILSELNKSGSFSTGDGENYALGILSGSNELPAKNWRWIRLQEAPMAENAVPGSAGNTNRASMINGRYDFYFEARVAHNPASQDFWNAIIIALGAQVPPVGTAFSGNMKYRRGTQVCQTPSVGF